MAIETEREHRRSYLEVFFAIACNFQVFIRKGEACIEIMENLESLFKSYDTG